MTSTKQGHSSADAMDWNEAMQLIYKMELDGFYRDAMLVAAGCFLGLRISDILQLRWQDLLTNQFTITEQKTGKVRTLRVNHRLRSMASVYWKIHGRPPKDSYIFVAEGKEVPLSRQAVDLMLKRMKVKYHIKSAKVFSSHSLRKTFGRRVWLLECDKGRGDQALLLLCEVFGHSSIAITKRYLGIRQEEIMSVYDSLD